MPERARPGFGRSVLTVLAGNVLPPLTALLAAPVLARSLGVDGRGAVAAAAATFTLVVLVTALGIPESVTYHVARRRAALVPAVRRGLAAVTLAGVTGTATMVLLSGWLSGGDPGIRDLVVLSAAAVVPSVWTGVLRGAAAGLQRWPLVTLERAVTSFGKLTVIVVLALTAHLTPTTATLALAFAPVLGAFAYVPLWRELARQRRAPADGPVALLSYGARVWWGSLAGIVLLRIDQVLLTPLSGVRELGLYVVAVAVAEVPLFLNDAIREVTFSTEAAARDPGRLAAATRVSSTLVLGTCLVLAAVSSSLVLVLFGDAFVGAVGPALVLLGAACVVTPGSVAAAGLSGRGRPGLRSAALGVACVVNVALMLALAPSLGALGAAWATLAADVVFTGVVVTMLWRTAGIRPVALVGLRRSDVDQVLAVARELVTAGRRRGRTRRGRGGPPPG